MPILRLIELQLRIIIIIITVCYNVQNDDQLHLISKKGRPTPACTPLLSSQNLKTVYCLYIHYFHLAECT